MAAQEFLVTVEGPAGARILLCLRREECQGAPAGEAGIEGATPRARVAAFAAILDEDCAPARWGSIRSPAAWTRAGRQARMGRLGESRLWRTPGGRDAGMRTYRITVEGEPFTVTVEELPAGPAGGSSRPTPPVRRRASAPHADPEDAAGHRASEMRAPMPGKILAVHAVAGEPVARGAVLVVLEAMKMENDLLASAEGRVKSVHVRSGDAVNTGDLLVVLQ